MFEYLVPHWWNCLGRVRRYDLVGVGMSLGAGFKISKAHAIQCGPLWLVVVSQDVRFRNYCSRAMPACSHAPHHDDYGP